jgi:tetratricopeptide (TPR) repeat protein
MADDESARGGPFSGAGGAFLAATLGTVSDNPRVDALLERQVALAELQIDSLRKLDDFELSHLRWRRLNDQMKGALQILTVLVGAVIVAAVAAALWNASRAEGLVVDAFSVPPALAQAGVTGDVVADDMTAKIAAIRDFANDNSLARSNDVSEDRTQAIKVEIPDTGVSLAEIWRYLRRWLGHERHLAGNLRSLPDGRIALNLSLDGAEAFGVAGAPGDLDALEQKAAEHVFAAADPVNIVLYLTAKGRKDEALAASARNIAQAKGSGELAEAYALHSNMVRYITGDVARSLPETQLALTLAPRQAPQHMEMLNSSRLLGHDEAVLAQARAIANLRIEDNVGAWRAGDGFGYVQQLGAIWRAQQTGDYGALAQVTCVYLCPRAGTALLHAEALARLHDGAGAGAALAQARSYGDADSASLAFAAYVRDADAGRWAAAAGDARATAAGYMADHSVGDRFNRLRVRNQAMPLLARALAAGGDVAAARQAIADTPLDCYGCLMARGGIEAAARDWPAAAQWFWRAAQAAPSIPFAYKDWGAMLLAKGDAGGAVAKFADAQARGPHYADPLELWGEALIVQNRSDLAVAKFAAAAQFAPNWGRLHLKWAQALLWSGDAAGARRQLALAASLDLTDADRRILAGLRT